MNGREIKARLAMLGRKQHELAIAADINNGTLCQMLNGFRRITENQERKICKGFLVLERENAATA